MKYVIRTIFFILAILYPLAVYFGMQHFQPRVISLLLIFMAVVYFLSPERMASKLQKYCILSGIGILVLCLQVLNDVIFIKLYPVLMNLIFLCAFAYTLINPPSMIERFARITHKDLPPFAIKYTKNVTIVWCVFLLFNSLVSVYTAFFASLATWTLYNGLIAYLLMGALFAGEYIVRYFVMRR